MPIAILYPIEGIDMPGQHAAKAAAVFIAMSAIATPLPEVIAETSTVTFVEVLSDPEGEDEGLTHLATEVRNYGCGDQ
ncbi:hypothetical protein Rhe02_85010 [Rhizocola hellebori]|uniref:Uncharacterized protein n=1 Tax=Rhizocola hellebori TaxID=1392758 RepID=A0A8J3VKF9_9ACTN|nr:hypothetical protein [Rhizocola hellebori]GIH10434.1 hypothetical protein Rhe02_85010 [Rhizocola hellebori]